MTASVPGSLTLVEASTSSPDATRRVGAALGGVLRAGDVVLLSGELGAGKTTFVQGMAEGLGIGEQVTSPTFTLVRPYPCPAPRSAGNPTAVRVLLHADLYRLETTAELADLALGELVEEEAAAVVEWGEAADAPLRAGAIVVELAVDAERPEVRAIGVAFPVGREADATELGRRLKPDKADSADTEG